MIVLRSGGMILASGLVLAACGGEQQQAQDETVPAETGIEPAAGRDATEGTEGMMNRMMAHMPMMAGADADSMQAMVPMHGQMAADMLAEMNREMRDMNMTPDAGWNATVDSLQQDLARMPEMSASELQAMMPGHHARMTRLMEMHRSMMSNVQT